MIVLDASAMLASLLDEPGGTGVDLLLETQPCTASIVSASEVHARLLRRGLSNERARARIDDLELRLLGLRRQEAELAAILQAPTRTLGLGIADRICIATGMLHDAPIYTADLAWAALDLPHADIQLVR